MKQRNASKLILYFMLDAFQEIMQNLVCLFVCLMWYSGTTQSQHLESNYVFRTFPTSITIPGTSSKLETLSGEGEEYGKRESFSLCCAGGWRFDMYCPLSPIVLYSTCGIEQQDFIFIMAFPCNASQQFLVMLTKIAGEYNLCYQVLEHLK